MFFSPNRLAFLKENFVLDFHINNVLMIIHGGAINGSGMEYFVPNMSFLLSFWRHQQMSSIVFVMDRSVDTLF